MLPLRSDEVQLLSAFLQCVIPPDHDSGAVEAGVLGFVQERLAGDPAMPELYRSGLMLLADRGFLGMTCREQEREILRLEGHPTIATMISHAIEGYYAGPESVGARAVGFRVTV